MGHKVSVVRGVKSDHFYEQKNGINEIWVGDVEVISRLPFGDSDQEQASWPAGGIPKIPWHHFIIPFQKRSDEGNMSSQHTLSSETHQTSPCTCMSRLPTTGYLGLYANMDSRYAYFIGMILLIGAYELNSLYWSAIFDHVRVRSIILARLPESDTDPAARKRALRALLRITLLRCGLRLSLSIFFAVMGLPALAAGVNQEYAAVDVLIFTLLGCFMAVILAVWGPICVTFTLCQPKWLKRALSRMIKLWNTVKGQREGI